MEYTITQDTISNYTWHIFGPTGGHWATFYTFSDAIIFCVASVNWPMMIDATNLDWSSN